MLEDITKLQTINFKNFMALPDGYYGLDSFAGNLSDCGVAISLNYANEFREDEFALDNMDELSHTLIAYGLWMQAKVSAFEALETMGFDAIKDSADCRATIAAESFYSGEPVEGEWCRRDGIIYVSYGGKIDTSGASSGHQKGERDSDDLARAKFMLGMMSKHIEDQLAA